MKQTPQELKLLTNFKPGKISKDGFLGNDTRHIHDIIQADQLTLSRLGITHEEIGNRLQFFIDRGKEGIENEIDLGEFTVKIFWSKGMLPCPFGEAELYYKIIATIYNKKSNKEIKYSQLTVHLIKEHGFFQGKGSVFRLEPEELVEFLSDWIN